MAALCTLDLLRSSAHHSIRLPCPLGSTSRPCKRAPMSYNSTFSIGRKGLNYKRLTLIPSAIVQPLTSSPDSSQLKASSEVEIKEDENKFNWFEQWYPVAPENDLDKRVPHAFTVLGLNLVIWWDKNEQGWRVFDDSCPHNEQGWRVFDDSCPHRRAPLSEGRIDEDGDLQCSYHGWCFGSRGECKHIPQAPLDGPPVHISKRAHAGVYPSLLQQGIIWFWPNTDPLYTDIALNKTPPLIPMLSDSSKRSGLTMRDFPYGYEVLTENLMDPSHIPYAHHGLLAPTFRPTGLNNMPRRAGKPLDFHVSNLAKSGFEGEREMGPATFIAPCIFIMKNLLPPSTKGNINTSISGSREEKMKTFAVIFICVPVAPGRSRLIATNARNFDTWADLLIPQWITHIRLNLILDSDLYLLHLQEHTLQEYGKRNWEKDCYVPTKADAFVVAFRKWLKRYSSGGIPWGEKFNDKLPPTPIKEQLMDRYQSHVVKCRSCKGALKVLRALEIITQILPIICVGILGVKEVNKQTTSSLYVWNAFLIGSALASFLISRWLSHFIYKTFYFHDYNHALVK